MRRVFVVFLFSVLLCVLVILAMDPAIPPPPTPEQAAALAAAAEEFNRELWILLSFGTLVTVLRTYARVRAVGFRNLQPDDYLAWVGMTFYGIESGLAYSVGAYARGLANNGMTDAHRAALPVDSEEHRLRVIGSIIQLCGWSTYSTLLWSFKAAWLAFYIRLTEGLSRNYRIRIYIGFGLVAVTWLAVVLNIFLGCRPFRRYWQINPDPGNVCHPAIANNIVWLGYSLNVSTDMYLISIPLPMLWGSRLHKWKKAGLLFLFSGGLFVMVCATLRCYYIVTNPVEGAQLAGSWAVRETFVALVTTNLPLVFTLVKGWLSPLFGSINSMISSKLSSQKGSGGTPKPIRTFGAGRSWRGHGPPTANPITDFTANESEERIVGGIRMDDMNRTAAEGQGSDQGSANIQKSIEFNVVTEDRAQHTRGNSSTTDFGNIENQPWDRAARGEHSAYAEGPQHPLRRNPSTRHS